MKDLENSIMYIDNLLAHSKTYKEHLILQDHIFTSLKQHGLKFNLENCFFGCQKVVYL